MIKWKDTHSSLLGSECRESHCRPVWCVSPQLKREHLIPQILIGEKNTQPRNFNWVSALGSFLEVTHRHGILTWLALATGSLDIMRSMVRHYSSVVLSPVIHKDHSLKVTLLIWTVWSSMILQIRQDMLYEKDIPKGHRPSARRRTQVIPQDP